MKHPMEYIRRHDRLHVAFSIRILAFNHKRVDSEYCTYADGINISPGGVSFKYPKVISKDDHLRVLIQDIKGLEDEEIMANIKVVWTEDKDMLSKRFGAKFVKIAPDKKYKLIKLIRNNGGE